MVVYDLKINYFFQNNNDEFDPRKFNKLSVCMYVISINSL